MLHLFAEAKFRGSCSKALAEYKIPIASDFVGFRCDQIPYGLSTAVMLRVLKKSERSISQRVLASREDDTRISASSRAHTWPWYFGFIAANIVCCLWYPLAVPFSTCGKALFHKSTRLHLSQLCGQDLWCMDLLSEKEYS